MIFKGEDADFYVEQIRMDQLYDKLGTDYKEISGWTGNSEYRERWTEFIIIK